VDEYHLLSFMRIADEERYLAVRDAVIVNPFSDKIVDPRALAIDVTSVVLLLKEGEEEVNGYAEEFMNGNAEWVEYARERFPTLGIVIRIFKKPGVVGKMN
jgi:hypothetical protein